MSAKEYPSRHADQFVVRLPDGMREKIANEARKNNRSMNAEIINRLSEYSDFGPRPASEANIPSRTTTKQESPYPLRMPDWLREDLQEAAHCNARSLHSEILDRLKGCKSATLRDEFAMRALPELMSDWRSTRGVIQETGFDEDMESIARECYEMADAMLRARGKA